jgi:hypothetical protein
LHSLAVLAATFLCTWDSPVTALRAAEADSGEAATHALDMLDRVPSLVRRRILESGGP